MPQQIPGQLFNAAVYTDPLVHYGSLSFEPRFNFLNPRRFIYRLFKLENNPGEGLCGITPTHRGGRAPAWDAFADLILPNDPQLTSLAMYKKAISKENFTWVIGAGILAIKKGDGSLDFLMRGLRDGTDLYMKMDMVLCSKFDNRGFNGMLRKLKQYMDLYGIAPIILMGQNGMFTPEDYLSVYPPDVESISEYNKVMAEFTSFASKRLSHGN